MMPPETIDKLTKLLGLATGRGAYDGERLAACDRLAALLVAHDLEWAQLLGGLSETDMRRLYDAGFEAGRESALEETKPSTTTSSSGRDWSFIRGSGSPTLGKAGLERVRRIFEAAAKAEEGGLLSEFESTFVGSIRERVAKYGGATFVSAKQQTILDRLEARFRECGFID
jgi:hypothetical protein